jgi:hypothetical protein
MRKKKRIFAFSEHNAPFAKVSFFSNMPQWNRRFAPVLQKGSQKRKRVLRTASWV